MTRTPGPRRGLAACILGAALFGVVTPGAALATGDGAISVTALTNAATGSAPRSGIVFTLGRVDGVDPTTAAGRATIAQLQTTIASHSPAVTDSVTLAATDAEGMVGLSGLDQGVYVLHEVGVRSSSGAVQADPLRYGDLLIPIPMADANGSPVNRIDVMPKPLGAVPVPAPTQPAPAPPVPDASLPPAPPVTTRINSGGGSEFTGATQWATIAAGAAIVAVAFLGTGRRRTDED